MTSIGAERVKQSGGRWAIPLILLAMLSFSLQDVAVKVIAEEVSIWQMQVVRSATVLALLVIIAMALGRRDELIPSRWRWPFLRSLTLTGTYLFFYTSLPFLTLAEAGAAFFAGPLMITVLAALLLGEPIGPRRIAAVVVGFIGVLIIVQPGAEGWRPVILMPVAAAACYALAMVMTRWRCKDEPGFSLTFTHNLLYATLGLLGVVLLPLAPIEPTNRASFPFLLEGWLPLSVLAASLLVATAATHIVGMLASVTAYRDEEASKIAPFEYAYLAIMPVWDIVIWGIAPSTSTLIGMALIIASGSFVAWREGRPARPRVQFKGETPWTPDAVEPTRSERLKLRSDDAHRPQ